MASQQPRMLPEPSLTFFIKSHPYPMYQQVWKDQYIRSQTTLSILLSLLPNYHLPTTSRSSFHSAHSAMFLKHSSAGHPGAGSASSRAPCTAAGPAHWHLPCSFRRRAGGCSVETGSHYVAQAGLGLSDPPASAGSS